uniref:Medium-chain acyl-[acyl-carrier-protein] hydrolase n=1 Tax=Candidatus Kentrum sp. TC TaxID=2126339 RepID=A0A450YZ13_9GAMM|nr:MAG: medium-chain acyl-[acyl-carrier-protein] hydrolase [Candidatus Kentron sp. TC]VFK48314.1 MAG: medium-chain acyl-[acyl-carrier-protein] hydrolase [Candidatus Kentron sp. TC]VFK61981.1 MAG: medium-chain acyl-[acyl-carrier-protein] hydrolase [Candidatus Kentron sp. TC]
MTDLWVAGSTNPKAKARLFCFPFAGGNTLAYRAWPKHFSSNIELRPVRLPGREGRFKETCYRNVVPLVQALASGLSSYLDLPFAFFGHSMGALLAFELARILRRQGRPGPFCLMVSGRKAPQISFSGRAFHKLPDSELIEELRNYGGTPEIILRQKEIMEIFLPVIRSDFAINETYTYMPDALLDCPIRAFGGEIDHLVSKPDLDAWRQQTMNDFALHMFSGGHFYLNGSEGHALARMVARELETAVIQYPKANDKSRL